MIDTISHRCKYALFVVLWGIAVALAVAPGGPLPLFAFCAYVPMGLLLRRLTLTGAIALWWCFGITLWIAGGWWSASAISVMAESGSAVGLLVLCGSAIVYGLPYAIFGAITVLLRLLDEPPRPFLAAAFLSILLHLFPLSRNINPGLGLLEFSNFLQSAELGGLPFLHWIICATGLSIGSALAMQRDQRRNLRPIMSSVVTLLLAQAYGIHAQALWHRTMPDMPRQAIGMLQPNLAPFGSGENLAASESIPQTLLDSSRALVRAHPQLKLLVWPEVPLPLAPLNNSGDRATVENLSAETGVPLLFNAVSYEHASDEATPYFNSVHLATPTGLAPSVYHKMHLVPFGEYIPSWVPERVRSSIRELDRYRPGKIAAVFSGADGAVIGTPICFEIVDSHVTGAMVKRGANLLIAPSNDGYFSSASGNELMFALSRLRAVEHRVSVVRVTNTGISACFNPLGEVMPGSRSPVNEAWSGACAPPIVTVGHPAPNEGFWFFMIMVGAVTLCGSIVKIYRQRWKLPVEEQRRDRVEDRYD